MKNDRLKVVEVYESECYKKDNDFKKENPKMDIDEISELKDNYYYSEFWIDSDKIFSNGKLIAYIVQVDNELIINYINDDVPIDLEKELINFYDNNIKDDFEYLDNGMFNSQEDNLKLYNEMLNSYIGVAFRGGSGYSFGYHSLKGYTTKDLLKDILH